MEFRILGPLEVREGVRVLEITRPKELLLLSVLLLEANRAVPMETIVDELWPHEPPAKSDDAIQQLVYELRRRLEQDRDRGSLIQRDGDAYRINLYRDKLDLDRFQRLVQQAERARREADLQVASATLTEALSLWRGSPLANVACEPTTATKAKVARLDDLRLNTLIARTEIELELGPGDNVVGDLEELIRQRPFDERLRGLLMLALYRLARPADALEAYRATYRVFDELGMEPGKRLRELEQQILRRDQALDQPPAADVRSGAAGARGAQERAVVAAAFDEPALSPLLAIAEPLALSQLGRELILAVIVPPNERTLENATATVREHRGRLIERGVDARSAAFTSSTPAEDLIRLAERESVDLLLMESDSQLLVNGGLSARSETVLAGAPCDVGIVVAKDQVELKGSVLVPFGGQGHDWAALELGAWVASATGLQLTLLGTRAGVGDTARDASRLLAEASLLLQSFLKISADVQLVEPGAGGILEAAADAALLVVGLPERWRQEGVGTTRLELSRRARVPLLLVRKGTRPGGIAPRDTTIFAWSLAIFVN